MAGTRSDALVGTTLASLRSVLLDTSGLFATASTNEHRHVEAAETWRTLLAGSVALLTTDLIVVELHALSLRRAGQRRALEIVASVLSSSRIEVVTIGLSGLDEAMTFLASREDRRYSLTDATSFVLMRRRRIDAAFTLDAGFAAEGFTLIPTASAPG